MLVRDCMSYHPVMVDPNMTLPEARKLMAENRIGHLPVVDDKKKLLGLLTRSHFAMSLDNVDSFDVWEISSKLTDLKVKNVMIKRREVITVAPDTTVEYAAKELVTNDISCLPVIEKDQLVGMITTIDLLKSYQEMLGLPVAGVRVTVRMPARSENYSNLAALVSAVGEQNWGVMGIGTFPTPNKPNCYDAVLKIVGVSTDEVRNLIEGLPNLSVIDIRDVT